MTRLALRDVRLAAGAACALGAGHHVVYARAGTALVDGEEVATGAAAYAPAASRVEAPAGADLLVWTLGGGAGADELLAVEVDVPGERLLRADRVDFPPGGVAFLHTHQGPGIRCLVEGLFAVETGGERHEIDLLGAWFEAGPEPVYAEVRGDAPAAFVRVMVLPAALLGTPSIRYVRDEDRDRPKSQRYTVFVDRPVGVVEG